MLTPFLALSFSPSALWDLIGKVHPVLVHFPVALLTVGGLFEMWSWRRRRTSSPEGILLFRIGALFAVVSAVSGWSFGTEEEASQTLWLHRWGGIAVAVVASAAAALTRGGAPGLTYRLLAVISIPLVGAVGHFGGELAWGEGYLLKAVQSVFADPEPEVPPAVASTPEEAHFLEQVWPTFRDNCLKCHGPTKQKGSMRFDDGAVVLGKPGIITPGDPEESDLIFLLRLPAGDEERMPPAEEAPPLAEDRIAAIEKWIADGAPWPAGILPGMPVADPEITETGFAPRLIDRFARVAYAETLSIDLTTADGEELFRTVVRPTLTARCTECHGETKQKAHMRLDRPDDLFDEAREERIVVPGDPDASALFERISLPHDDEDRMPPKGDPLGDELVAGFRAWIAAGAPWVEQENLEESERVVEPDGSITIDSRHLSEVLFRTAIDPVLVERCQECHGPQKQNGDFRVDRGSSLLSKITPGRPDESELLRRVSLPPGDEDHMPKKGRPLTPLELEALEAWIASGAPIPIPGRGGSSRSRGAHPLSAPGAVTDPDITLTAEQQGVVENALARLREAGARAARISLAGPEVEVSTALLRDAANDRTLELLAGLEPALVRLDLSGAAITDAGALSLGVLAELRVLNLGRTPVGDAALGAIATLPHLEVLNLHGTRVTDVGLAALHTHPTLRRIYLWESSVTDAGVEALGAARPELRIVRGD